MSHRKVWPGDGPAMVSLTPWSSAECFQRSTEDLASIKIICPHPLILLMGKWRPDCLRDFSKATGEFVDGDRPAHCLQGAMATRSCMENLTYLGASLMKVPRNVLWDFMKPKE